MWNGLIHWLQVHALTCYYKKYMGMECPGCGFQRSLVLLLKGNLSASLHMYPALLPILAMFGFLLLHLVFRFQRGGVYLMKGFILVTVIVLSSYILRMCHMM